MAAYVKTIWKDRVTTYQNRYVMSENPDGTVTLTPFAGAVTEPGTPVNAERLNKIEDELYKLDGASGKLIIGDTIYPVVIGNTEAEGQITLVP